jgi:hypothetical protein
MRMGGEVRLVHLVPSAGCVAWMRGDLLLHAASDAAQSALKHVQVV